MEKRAAIIPPQNLATTSLIQNAFITWKPNSGVPIAKATVGASSWKAVQEPTTMNVLIKRM